MVESKKIAQLVFSDVYLGHPLLGDLVADASGGALSPLANDELLHEDLDRLKRTCSDTWLASTHGDHFRVTHDEMDYRVSVMKTVNGTVFVLRRVEEVVRSLADTGMPPAYFSRLLDGELSGLFIVSGAVKAGKTTTASALLKARLEQFGGLAVTVENPIELPLEGRHGAGACYQTLADNATGGFLEGFRRCVRWGARTIFIGEIAECAVAAEVLQASMNGHLIIATMQAASVVRTIVKLQALASERLDPAGVQSMLADGLAGVLHQRLSLEPRRKLETEFLFLKDAAAAKSNIRHGRYEMLASEIRQQVASMIVERAVIRHVGK